MNRLLFFIGLLGLTLANFSFHGIVGKSESDAKSILEQHLKVFDKMIQKGNKKVLKKMIPSENQTDEYLDDLVIIHRSIKMEVANAEYTNGSKDLIEGKVYYSKDGRSKFNFVITIKKESQSPSGYQLVEVIFKPTNEKSVVCLTGFIWCYLHNIDILPESS